MIGHPPESPEGLVAEIEAALIATSNPERARNEKRYLKSDLRFIGVAKPLIRRAVRPALRSGAISDRDSLLGFAGASWATGVHELRVTAILALQEKSELLEIRDMGFIEDLIRQSKTWAYVDPLSIYLTGSLVERFPELTSTLDRWSTDDDFWVRRSAILALLIPLRQGEGDFDRFGRYADGMLEEKEFFVRKAIGWVLREVSKKRPDLVFDWIAPRTDRASGVTMREVVKYLPADRQEVLMSAYKGRRAVGTR